ncbi:hypothetical protein VOI54_09355 [Tamlana sp. 2201CG12-4]|uniref:hypothetical protein n=1 Tax=Tamlana sp. 2201CG12-4 TaxID=3112582 RepID=UPI002DB817A0|nr:hypothetical protein [Tamlana sp. 2201CG12-4]MEC3907228.1 hypothetical protein [Tamlana sp. 2201CG12-4]
MSKKKENHSINIWTIIDKLKYFILIIISIVIIIILFKGYSIETKYFKIGKVPDTLYIEKETKTPPDTVYKEKIVTKYITAPQKKTTKIKKTGVEVDLGNQPANVNTGTNNGVIGNNNTINNLNEKPVILNDSDKKILINLVEKELKKVSNKEKKNISVEAASTGTRTIKLAHLIRKFLNSKGYNAGSDLGIYGNALPPVKGINISSMNNFVIVTVGHI